MEGNFKVLGGTIHVVPPDGGPAIERPAQLVYDAEQDAVGAMFIGAGELRGYCVFILREQLAQVIAKGRAVSKLEIPR
jgi:hypothetical protein